MSKLKKHISDLTRQFGLWKRPGRAAVLLWSEVDDLRRSDESHRAAADRLGVPYRAVYDARFGRTFRDMIEPPAWLTYLDGRERIRLTAAKDDDEP